MKRCRDSLADLLALMDSRFTSGNAVPVERAHITQAEWDVMRTALCATGKKRRELIEMHVSARRQIGYLVARDRIRDGGVRAEEIPPESMRKIMEGAARGQAVASVLLVLSRKGSP